MQARPAEASRTELSEFVMPHLANQNGSLHGGELLSRIDKAAAVCAMRHAGRPCVTASVDSVDFHRPIEISAVIRLVAMVHYVGRSSIEVGVEVYAENPVTREVDHTNSCFLTMVGVDENGRPHPVPGVLQDTDEAKRRYAAGKARAAERRARRHHQA